MPEHKLIETLERDIRNQVTIDQMKKLNRRQQPMVYFHRYTRFNYLLTLALFFCAIIWIILCCTIVHAADAPTLTCPNPGEPCKVLLLTPQEEKMLMGTNGILDTAAQGRSLDLGQFAVYLKTRIAAAPAGEIKAAPVAETKGDKQVSPAQ